MQSMLASTFQLWPPNVESLVKNAEDMAFLESMKGDRAARFGIFDKTLAMKVSRRNCQGASEFQCLNRAHHEIETSTATVSSEVITDESDTDKPGESVWLRKMIWNLKLYQKDSTTANTTNRNNGIHTTKCAKPTKPRVTCNFTEDDTNTVSGI